MCDVIKIGERIKETRIAEGLTQEALGKAVGVNKSTIQRYENGKIKKIKLPVIDSIAKSLYVNPAWLVFRSDKKTLQTISSPEPLDEGIELYKRLDVIDKAEIRGMIKQMLKNPKYKNGICISDDIVKTLKEETAISTTLK